MKEKINKYGILGGIFSGVGSLGAFGVCHTICQGIIIGLAAIGITIIGMPFAFLQEPWFMILSFGIGGIFLIMAFLTYTRHRKMERKM
ncbi:MAG: hypothetical protein AAB622_02620 [Patescibacteria group bacterium]